MTGLKSAALITAMSLAFSLSIDALDNGQALTPPMGWSSWNSFRVNISEKMIRAMADSMVSSGMRDAGYRYINIDDGWGYGRDANGTVTCRTDRFPSGMKALADYIHSKGLKAGIYTDVGRRTCAMMFDNEQIPGYGAYGHYEQDLRTFFVDWGYDYLKVDWCGGQEQDLNQQTAYTAVRDAILATGKPVFYNVCSWAFPGQWVVNVANSWRISSDIGEDYEEWCQIAEIAEGLARYHGPGHWNDADMMQIGTGGSYDEDKSHMSLWCIIASPLIAGNDLRSMSAQTKSILTNKEVIAVNQDPRGICGKRALTGTRQVWVKPLADSGRAVLLQNKGTAAASISFTRAQIGLPNGGMIRDLWEHKDLGAMGQSFSASVPGHGVVMVRIGGATTGAVSKSVRNRSIGREATVTADCFDPAGRIVSGEKSMRSRGKSSGITIRAESGSVGLRRVFYE